jgi:phosphoribosylaminoimidazolecarboxamide formyltransferase/IMP cyclohydrolase
MNQPSEPIRLRRALISVYDKAGLLELARCLADLGVEILSTGGTLRALEEADGRVKTLHPAVHGGLLADRSRLDHLERIAALGIAPIDLVVVNLYPFSVVTARPGVTWEEAIENIDIGGPAMVRSAAKNHAGVGVVTDPEQYADLCAELRGSGGLLSAATRRALARQAFQRTSAYDAAIGAFLSDGEEAPLEFPARLTLSLERAQGLRYGENPHQRAAFYPDPAPREPGVATARQIHGDELSFVNLLDLDAALNLVKEFDRPACAIIKHTNPCGCGVADTLAAAYALARDGELPPFNPPGSRFGGIIACNRPLDEATANEMVAPQSFYHAIIAPEFTPEALAILTGRKGWGATVRLLATGPLPSFAELAAEARGVERLDFKRVVGGMLVQERDLALTHAKDLQVVTERAPTEEEAADLLFAWSIVRHVKSNAIVLVFDGQLIGLGAGQVNRAEPCALAVKMAGPRAQGAIAASDAFFPFSDGPETLAQAGVVAIIQPGGAKHDQASIDLCNRYGVAMVFTGRRHFRH